jgi:hypothetical protein
MRQEVTNLEQLLDRISAGADHREPVPSRSIVEAVGNRSFGPLLPEWLLNRSVGHRKLCKAVTWLRRPARFADGIFRLRWTVLTRGAGVHVIAVVCLLTALTVPVLELVPFSNTAAGGAASPGPANSDAPLPRVPIIPISG